MKKKYLLSSIFLSTFALSAAIITACSASTKSAEKQEEPQLEVTKVARNSQPNYQEEVRKNGLFVDAEEKANATNNVLMYSINWAAVLHKYGSFLHFLKVLEINPNKEIYIYVQSDSNKQSSYSLFSYIANLKDKFPNVNLRIIDKWNSWETFLFHHAIIENDLKNLKDKKVDIYLDDYAILNTIAEYQNLVNAGKSVISANQLILDNYLFLSKMNSINLFSDGSASFRFYDNNFVKGLALTNNLFDNETNSFKLSNEIRKDLYLGNISKNELLNKSKYSGALLLQSFVTSFDPLNETNTIPTKYFNPGTTTIIDMNSDNSLALSSLKNSGLFFDPYYSVSANIIGFFKSLKSETKKLFQSALNIQETEDKNSLMSNKLSIVYSGRLMDGEILTQEASRIISMYKNEKTLLERERL